MSEAEFRATFEQAAVGIAHVALDGGWLRVNDRLCAITGHAREALLGLTFQQITHPDDLAADLAQVEALLAGTIDTFAMEKRYIRADGAVVWVNLTASLLRDAAGRPERFISVIEDISARRAAEAALAGSEAALPHAVRADGGGLRAVGGDARRRRDGHRFPPGGAQRRDRPGDRATAAGLHRPQPADAVPRHAAASLRRACARPSRPASRRRWRSRRARSGAGSACGSSARPGAGGGAGARRDRTRRRRGRDPRQRGDAAPGAGQPVLPSSACWRRTGRCWMPTGRRWKPPASRWRRCAAGPSGTPIGGRTTRRWQARVREACLRAAAGETSRYDIEVRMAGDSRMAIDFQVAPLRDAAGRVTHLIPSAVDITARKRSEEAKMLLAREVDHRAKNALAVVQSVLTPDPRRRTRRPSRRR